MVNILRKSCIILGVLFFLAALYPFLTGVRNIGIVLVLALSVFSFAFPMLLKIGLKHSWVKTTTIWTYVIGTAALVVLSVAMIVAGYGNNPPADGKPYTVIVLGAQVRGDQPSGILRNRLLAARDYLNENPNATVIVSGGQGADEIYPEAEVMANYLVAVGIDRSRIQEEGASTNTEENLSFSMALLPEDSAGVVVVTDAFHQKRASILAKSVGIEGNYGVSSFTPIGLMPVYWMRDLCGIPYTWLMKIIFK